MRQVPPALVRARPEETFAFDKSPVFVRLAFCLLLFPKHAVAGELGCKGNPSLTDKCYATFGEVVLSADIGYVFGPVEKSRAKVVRAAPGSSRDMPPAMLRVMNGDPVYTTITGDFLVCPIPEQASQFIRHEAQYVCIESATHVSVTSRRTEFKAAPR